MVKARDLDTTRVSNICQCLVLICIVCIFIDELVLTDGMCNVLGMYLHYVVFLL